MIRDLAMARKLQREEDQVAAREAGSRRSSGNQEVILVGTPVDLSSEERRMMRMAQEDLDLTNHHPIIWEESAATPMSSFARMLMFSEGFYHAILPPNQTMKLD